MSGVGNVQGPRDSLAQAVFTDLTADNPNFKELRNLLLHGRKSEAISLICQNDNRFDSEEAQRLVNLVMNTLRDTVIEK